MSKRPFSFFFFLTCIFLAGCASKPPSYSGVTFPPTTGAEIVFQEKSVPAQCRAFSHIIVHTPTGVSGATIGQRLTDFAKSKGADLILMGISRKSADKGPGDFQFYSYGPKQDYLFSKGWLGWKFGFDDWEKGGGMIGFGYTNLSDATANDFSMKIQAVLLRCAPDHQ